MTPPSFRSSASRSVTPDYLRPGDHVLVRRHGVLYSHHGVMVEEGRIIHYTDEAGLEADLFSAGFVSGDIQYRLSQL